MRWALWVFLMTIVDSQPSGFCPYNMYYTSGKCVVCPAGKNVDSNTGLTCLDCTAGSFGLNGVCSLCSVGTYQSLTGASFCSRCAYPLTSYWPYTSCSSCYYGTYASPTSTGDWCQTCPVGYYSMSLGRTYCDPCALGSSTLTSNMYCDQCTAGKYTSSPGPCLSCAVGTNAGGSGLSACSQCSAGTYASATGLAQCSTCSAGQYADVQGLSVCKQCPSGKTGDQSGTACNTCAQGRYIAADSRCASCQDGTYSTGTGLSVCTSCVPGKTNDALRTACALCTAGTYTSASGIGPCTACQPGTYQSGSGSTTCPNCATGQSNDAASTGCVRCAAGTFASAAGLCNACPLGTFSDTQGVSSCLLCSSGKYSIQVGCNSCSLGTYASQSGSSACSQCSAGQYTSAVGISACTLCSPGWVNVVAAATVCSVCTQGTFSSGLGGSLCRICLSGTYSTNTGVSVCTSCPAGTIGNASSSTSCFDCPIGTYALGVANIACSSCPAGAYATSSSTGQCTQCTAGKYMTLTGQTSPDVCIQCDMGTYTSSGGLTVCASCPYGQLSNDAQIGCTSVLKGTMCPAGAYSLTAGGCVYCPAGTFAYFAGALACQPCPANTGSLRGARQCTACENNNACRMASGAVCPTCASACTACVAGKYNDGKSQRCVACAAGTYSGFVQAQSPAVCSQCNTGYTTSPLAVGLTQCVTCASLNQVPPNNALNVYTQLSLVCVWTCNQGYVRIVADEATFRITSYPNYTYQQALSIFHVQNDYCCNPTIVGIGMYLVGCNRSSDGVPFTCRPMANGYYIRGNVDQIDNCRDWACNPNAYSNGTTCLLHPVCKQGYTYNRTTTGELVTLPFTPYTCVPCSKCMDGSETMVPCNGTVDTQCAKCSGANYSANGSACIASLPLGYIGVRMRLSRLPPFQGRPAVYSDGRPINWGAIDFANGVFFNSYTPCQPLDSPNSMYMSQSDLPCQTTDNAAADLCAYPKCSTQCKPWNGTAGWFRQANGQCASCTYDSTCAQDQYSDLSVCGPVSAPQCTPCPSLLPPNVLRWTNPGRFLPPGYPVCDVVCRDGYAKTSNFTCVQCTNIPPNARIMSGCSWACSLGFYQPSGSKSCTPCPFNISSCPVGAYLGYGSYCGFNGQCPCCLPCINYVPNAGFVSSGINNGPNTCAVRCMRGFYIDPMYGLDIFGNPVSCAPCSYLKCVAGISYLVACTTTADAFCAPCSVCPVGYKVATRCTIGANTTCTPCAPAPPNASWAVGCEAWACNTGFYLGDGGVCSQCKQPYDCTNADRYNLIIPPACGACIPCDPTVLLPGQCFNGDGQCGATYRCGPVRPIAQTMSTSTAMMNTTAVVLRTSSYMTNIYNTTPWPMSYNTTPWPNSTTGLNATNNTPAPGDIFATLMTLTLSSGISLADLLKAISCPQQACEIKLVSKTSNGTTTTFCVGSGCRRLLADAEQMVIEVLIITREPLQNVPTVNTSIIEHPVAVDATASYRIVDPSILNNPVQLSALIRDDDSLKSSQGPQIWLVVLISIFACGLGAGVLVVMFMRRDRAPVLTQRFGYDWSRVRINFV